VLTVSTVLSRPDLSIEVHSTYTGHPSGPTHSTHLRIGPVGQEPTLDDAVDGGHDIPVTYEPRDCVYDHVHRLLDFLDELGHAASAELDDRSFVVLEAVEPNRGT
jgi:hypothetical protein